MAQSSQFRGQSDLGATAADLKDKASDQFKKVADRVEDIATSAADQTQEMGERMQEMAGNVRGAINKSVKEQPMTTLAIAAMAGFVLGALWKS